MEFSGMARTRSAGNLISTSRSCAPDSGTACVRLVLLRDGAPVCAADFIWRSIATLSRRFARFFRHRSRAFTAIQYRPNVAPATRDLLGGYLIPGRRHFSRAHDYGAG